MAYGSKSLSWQAWFVRKLNWEIRASIFVFLSVEGIILEMQDLEKNNEDEKS